MHRCTRPSHRMRQQGKAQHSTAQHCTTNPYRHSPLPALNMRRKCKSKAHAFQCTPWVHAFQCTPWVHAFQCTPWVPRILVAHVGVELPSSVLIQRATNAPDQAEQEPHLRVVARHSTAHHTGTIGGPKPKGSRPGSVRPAGTKRWARPTLSAFAALAPLPRPGTACKPCCCTKTKPSS